MMCKNVGQGAKEDKREREHFPIRNEIFMNITYGVLIFAVPCTVSGVCKASKHTLIHQRKLTYFIVIYKLFFVYMLLLLNMSSHQTQMNDVLLTGNDEATVPWCDICHNITYRVNKFIAWMM